MGVTECSQDWCVNVINLLSNLFDFGLEVLDLRVIAHVLRWILASYWMDIAQLAITSVSAIFIKF